MEWQPLAMLAMRPQGAALNLLIKQHTEIGEVWQTLTVLLLTIPASTCLQHSCNLEHRLIFEAFGLPGPHIGSWDFWWFILLLQITVGSFRNTMCARRQKRGPEDRYCLIPSSDSSPRVPLQLFVAADWRRWHFAEMPKNAFYSWWAGNTEYTSVGPIFNALFGDQSVETIHLLRRDFPWNNKKYFKTKSWQKLDIIEVFWYLINIQNETSNSSKWEGHLKYKFPH